VIGKTTPMVIASPPPLLRLQAIVSLYQALGGGWLPKPVDAADAR